MDALEHEPQDIVLYVASTHIIPLDGVYRSCSSDKSMLAPKYVLTNPLAGPFTTTSV
jgi:hypothetical protein